MSDTIIRVENLGKKYIIDHQQEERSHYIALRDLIANGAKSLLKTIQNPKSKIQNHYEEFWALKDVSFEVKQGDVIGIIGRNGAGKSTLLKILSRITEPTTGKVELRGRVASLLEVGTGFHPELTGRENIFLNGAILGMAKAEIQRKFDEIVAFAEVEKFLDTPVKRYSSGMYMRLAFAVAAHLEPEILVVDEVLAVGDITFQKKCLGKMEDVAAKEGRTILFVSHNMVAIKQLCTEAILLKEGKIIEQGVSSKIVDEYLIGEQHKKQDGIISKSDHYHNPLGLLFNRVIIFDRDRQLTANLKFRDKLLILVEFEVLKFIENEIRLGIVICSLEGHLITAFHQTDDPKCKINSLSVGKYTAKMETQLDLMPGHYNISIFAKPMPGFWSSEDYSLDFVENAVMFSVDDEYNQHADHRVLPSGSIVLPQSQWSIVKNN